METLLIVRAGHYFDRRLQAFIDNNRKLWEMQETNNYIQIVTKTVPPLWWKDYRKDYSFNYFRYWAAWEEWKVNPADFLAITDIDVIPTSKFSVLKLYEFLKSIPHDVGVVTREPIRNPRPRPPKWGLDLNPSEGLLVLARKYIPAILLSQAYNFLLTCPPSREKDYIDLTEGMLLRGLPPLKMVTFPKELLICVNAAGEFPLERMSQSAFIHPSGNNLNFQLHKFVLELMWGGDFENDNRFVKG